MKSMYNKSSIRTHDFIEWKYGEKKYEMRVLCYVSKSSACALCTYTPLKMFCHLDKFAPVFFSSMQRSKIFIVLIYHAGV